MRLSCRTALSALTLTLHATAAGAAEPPPVESFARIPLLRNVDVSPDGNAFTARIAAGGREGVAIFEMTPDGFKHTYAVAETKGARFKWIAWKTSDTLLVSFRYPAKRFGVDTEETRLMSIGRNGGKLTRLYRYTREELPVQFEDAIVSWLPQDPDYVLVQYSRTDPQSPGVFRVPVDRKLHRPVEGPRSGVTDWVADAQGRVRAGYGYSRPDSLKPQLVMRLADENRWRDFSALLADGAPSFTVLGFAPDGKTAYVASDFEQGPPPVYEFNLETGAFRRKIFEHPDIEASRLRFDPVSGALVGISYIADEPQAIWLDDQIAAELAAIRRSLPGKSVDIVDFSINGEHAVLFVSSPDDPGGYYIFNRPEKHLVQLPPNYPTLQGVTLGKVIATSYAARDGLEIPAYVTLPPGISSLEEARRLPFVINPHGGPHARDFIGFDYWAQFFASRGYGVLQMNFRGSSGYGAAFRSAGKREWGQAMQDDITDGVMWLAAQGYADAGRIAIAGGSYGGYAALMGLAKTPDLYRCGISFAGVSDLPDLIRDMQRYIGGKAGARHIGRLWKDRPMLAENSPARRAADITAPVLLVHGQDDRVVSVDQSKKMRSALEKAGRKVSYVELKGGDHYLSSYPDRLTFLTESEEFLSACLGAG